MAQPVSCPLHTVPCGTASITPSAYSAVWHSQYRALCIQCRVAQPVSYPLHTVLCGTASIAPSAYSAVWHSQYRALCIRCRVAQQKTPAKLNFVNKCILNLLRCEVNTEHQVGCRTSLLQNFCVYCQHDSANTGTVADQNQCLAVQNNTTSVYTCAGHSSFLLLQLHSHENPLFSNFHK